MHRQTKHHQSPFSVRLHLLSVLNELYDKHHPPTNLYCKYVIGDHRLVHNLFEPMDFRTSSSGGSSYPVPFKYNLSSHFKIVSFDCALMAAIYSAIVGETFKAIFVSLSSSRFVKQTVSVLPFLLQ